jgi:hypothetical protein
MDRRRDRSEPRTLEEPCDQAPRRRRQLDPTQNRSQAAEPGSQSPRDAAGHAQCKGGGQHRPGHGEDDDEEHRGGSPDTCRGLFDCSERIAAEPLPADLGRNRSASPLVVFHTRTAVLQVLLRHVK